jgi:hypothetical protein
MKAECIIDNRLLDLEQITHEYSLDRDPLLMMQARDESFQVFQDVRRHSIMAETDTLRLEFRVPPKKNIYHHPRSYENSCNDKQCIYLFLRFLS